ncbi:MAG: glycosyltransferase family 4 protein [Mucilaginibacter sp.]
MMRLAIITTHPIQYYAPVFKLLHERQRIAVKVFYTWGETALDKYDPDFGKKITWDLPLLDGYPFEWVKNTAADAGSHHFKGIINPGLINQVNNYKPDAVLFIGWAYHSHLKAMRYFKNKVPVFFRGDSTLLDEKPTLRSFLKSFFLKWVYSHVDHAFYTGTHNKAYFKKYGLKDNQLTFAPHAVDNNRFKTNRHTEAQELRNRLGLKDEDILILFAGKFEPKKNPEILLDAVLKINNPKIHLLFTGNGQLESALKQKAQHSPNIHFIDFQNQTNMPVVYQACNLFCLPSKGPGESWGLAVNEAMACSKAVLVSDKCGCAIDLVINNKNGAIFKSENMDDLTAHLNQLTKTRDGLTDLGKTSALLIEDWNFLTIAETIEQKLLNEAQR